MSTTTSQPEQVDVRGPRFAAWITTAILVLTLVLSTFSLPAATTLLALQAIVFAIGAVAGPKRSPYGLIYGKLVALAPHPCANVNLLRRCASHSSSASSSHLPEPSDSLRDPPSSARWPQALPCSPHF